MVITTINPSEIVVINQLNAILGAPHCSYGGQCPLVYVHPTTAEPAAGAGAAAATLCAAAAAPGLPAGCGWCGGCGGPVEVATVVETCGAGSIPINTIFRGMNIHLPAILM